MAFTLRLSEAADTRLREQAALERRPLTAILEAALEEYVDRRSLSARVDGALDVLSPRYADLLDRLGRA